MLSIGPPLLFFRIRHGSGLFYGLGREEAWRGPPPLQTTPLYQKDAVSRTEPAKLALELSFRQHNQGWPPMRAGARPLTAGQLIDQRLLLDQAKRLAGADGGMAGQCGEQRVAP